jgi:hypothetical protein|tara:strand:+ start:2794 stop:3072 length:279 start_codon:yes stop_codon:yes gene_type:complete
MSQTEWVYGVTCSYNLSGEVRVDYIPITAAPWWAFIPVLCSVFNYGGEKYYTGDNLPERLKSRIALLSICEEFSYVEGIGYHHNEGIFYVTD